MSDPVFERFKAELAAEVEQAVAGGCTILSVSSSGPRSNCCCPLGVRTKHDDWPFPISHVAASAWKLDQVAAHSFIEGFETGISIETGDVYRDLGIEYHKRFVAQPGGVS